MTEINRTETSKTKNIETVVLKGSSTKTNIQTPEMSTNKLTISTIKKMPAVLGEVDVLKSILQLPGVANAGEGSSGFNVRGGSVDENLVLLDEAIIYNTTHLFGFFSVFNSDVIKDLKLYKGGIPANFGGRVSSVLDIYQKEGHNRESVSYTHLDVYKRQVLALVSTFQVKAQNAKQDSTKRKW